MNYHKWKGTDVPMIESIIQEATPRCDWPYDRQDWIVSSIHHDTGNHMLWIHGRLRSGERFAWGHYWDRRRRRPLSWRYDLTNTTYQLGRHENDAEMWQRIEAERRVDRERLKVGPFPSHCLVACNDSQERHPNGA